MSQKSRRTPAAGAEAIKGKRTSPKKRTEDPQPSKTFTSSDVFGLDATGCLVIEDACFDGWEELFGKPPEGLSIGPHALAEASPTEFKSLRTYNKGELHSTSGGEEKVFCHLMAPVIKNGQARGILGVNIDVTELKRAHDKLQMEVRSQTEALEETNRRLQEEVARIRELEKTVRESAKRYRILFEQSPICLWESDCSELKLYIDSLKKKGVTDFRTFFQQHPETLSACIEKVKALDANETSVKTYRAASKEDLLQGYGRAFLAEPSESFAEGIIAYAQDNDSFECEAMQQTFDGEEKVFALKWVIVPGPWQERTRLLSSLVDITPLKEVQEEFRKFKIISDESNFGNAICDLQGTFLYVNEAFARMYGYTEDELIGKHFSILVPGDSRFDIPTMEQSLFANYAGSLKNLELQHQRKDGSTIPCLMNVKVITDKKGRPQYVASSTLDITIRKQAEENLMKRDRELEEKNTSLEEMNTALKVLLRNRQTDKLEIQEKILANIKTVVLPFLKKLRTSTLTDKQQVQLTMLESALNEVISPFLQNISSKYSGLTQAELQVAHLVKEGKSAKEIAEIMFLSKRSVDTYRGRIRQKLGIINKKVNLRTHLLSF